MDNKLKTVDAETLLSTPMSKTMFIVDGLISQGVNVISGASKIGKSWLMLWLGLQVAQGNSIWGLPTLQCDVLYLSLEDTQRRIKDRLYSLTDSAPDNLYFAVTSGLIGGGLEEQITDFLTEHSATKLVIIDTLQKVRDSKGSAGKAGMNDREVNPEKYIAPKNWYKYGSEMVRPYKIRIHPPCAKDEKKLRGYYESKLAALPDVMDVAAAVDFTGYNRRTVCQWIRVGKLKALALLQKYMIPKCYLIDWLCSDDYNNTNRKSRRHIDMLWEAQKWNDMR